MIELSRPLTTNATAALPPFGRHPARAAGWETGDGRRLTPPAGPGSLKTPPMLFGSPTQALAADDATVVSAFSPGVTD